MNPTKYRNPGRTTAQAFAATALATTFFLVLKAVHAANEITADTTNAVATEKSAAADAATTDAVTASSEADASTCAVMRTAPAGITTTLDRGHADIFDLTSSASGILTLHIKEDTTGSGVMRKPEQMLLAVNKSTLTQIPVSVSQAIGVPTAAYFLGQSGDNQATALWPGRDTLGVTADGYDAARFHISYTGPEDGCIYAFTSNFTEGTKAVTSDGSFDLIPEGDNIDQPYATHKHVDWLFTHAGRYTLTVRTSAWTPGNTGATNTVAPAHAYTIGVANGASCLIESGSAPSTDQVQPTPAPGVDDAAGTPSAPVPAPGMMEMTGTTGMTTGANPTPSSSAHTTSGTTGGEHCVATRITHEATEAEAATLASNNAPANTACTTLAVGVGDSASGNAADGHLDLESAIENGTLVARIKDNRIQSAQWVDPSSLTFVLGDATRITAPTDLGFAATLGSSVWLIPSTQIVGIPWLDLNSQCEEIVTDTTDPVQFTLDVVEDPGRVAVFNAGALGSGVGEHVFDSPGTDCTLDTSMHAHQNWVFTMSGTYTLAITMRVTPNDAALANSGFGSDGDLTTTGAANPNGRPMVSQVVGRTAPGKECGLSLATTGANTISLTVISLTWAPTDTTCVWVGAIGRRRNLYEAL